MGFSNNLSLIKIMAYKKSSFKKRVTPKKRRTYKKKKTFRAKRIGAKMIKRQ
jgi:hypothetical protein